MKGALDEKSWGLEVKGFFEGLELDGKHWTGWLVAGFRKVRDRPVLKGFTWGVDWGKSGFEDIYV